MGRSLRERREERAFVRRPRGCIDAPARDAELPRAPIDVRGWCLFPRSAVARVELAAGAGAPQRARLAVERPDIAPRVGRPDAPICGFEHTFEADEVAPGGGELTIRGVAHALDGTRFELEPLTCTVAVAPAPGGDADAATLRSRSLPASTRPREARPALHILAMTHMLVHGGASLYLLELLRRLVERPEFSCELVTLSDGPLRGELERIGIPVHVTDGFPVTSMARYEGHVAELAAWAAARDFDVAFVNALWCFPGIDVAALLGIPAVWSLHESFPPPLFWSTAYPPGSLDPYVRARGERALRATSAAVFQAEATRRLFVPYAQGERLVTIPYGIELDAIDAARATLDRDAVRRELDIAPDARVVLCLGSIEARKSQTMLAQAFAEIADRHPSALLALVGANDDAYCAGYRAALREYVSRAGLERRVRIEPVTGEPYRWHAAADAVVCASDIESLPRSIVEAMAFEKPVLSTRVFGVPEIVEDGRTGFLCDMRDLAEMSRALDRLLGASDEQLATITRDASAVARARHDPDRYAAKIGRLLERLAAEPAALPATVLAQPQAAA